MGSGTRVQVSQLEKARAFFFIYLHPTKCKSEDGKSSEGGSCCIVLSIKSKNDLSCIQLEQFYSSPAPSLQREVMIALVLSF